MSKLGSVFCSQRATTCGDQKISVGSQQRALHTQSRLRKGNPPSFPPLPAPSTRGPTTAHGFAPSCQWLRPSCQWCTAARDARGKRARRPEPIFRRRSRRPQIRNHAWLRGSWMDVLSRRAIGIFFFSGLLEASWVNKFLNAGERERRRERSNPAPYLVLPPRVACLTRARAGPAPATARHGSQGLFCASCCAGGFARRRGSLYVCVFHHGHADG